MNEPALTNPIPLDDAICYQAGDAVLIEPLARRSRWLPFGLVAVLLFFVALLTLLTFVAILDNFGIGALIGGLIRLLILAAVGAGLAFSLHVQWRSLRTPVIYTNREARLVELVWANAIRRIPFYAVIEVKVDDYTGTDAIERRVHHWLRRYQMRRLGVGLVLKHGETVWCGAVTGDAALGSADAVKQRLLNVIG